LLFIYLSNQQQLEGKFVLRFKYPTKFHSRSFGILKLFIQRGPRQSKKKRKEINQGKRRRETELSRDKGNSLSSTWLVRSLVWRDVAAQKRIVIIYGFLMRRQSVEATDQSMAIFINTLSLALSLSISLALSLSTYSYIVDIF